MGLGNITEGMVMVSCAVSHSFARRTERRRLAVETSDLLLFGYVDGAKEYMHLVAPIFHPLTSGSCTDSGHSVRDAPESPILAWE